MMKQIFKKHSGDVKIVDRLDEGNKLNTIYMAFNQGGLLPIVVPLRPKNVCVAGTSCDRYR